MNSTTSSSSNMTTGGSVPPGPVRMTSDAEGLAVCWLLIAIMLAMMLLARR